MKYLKKLKVELDDLADVLGRTATSHFKYDQGKLCTRARLLQSMIAIQKLVLALNSEFDEWCLDNSGEWARFLEKLEKWIQNRPTPDSPVLPGYHEMLLDLCTRLHIPGTPTFQGALVHLEKQLDKLGKVQLLMLNNDGTVAGRQAKIHDILWDS